MSDTILQWVVIAGIIAVLMAGAPYEEGCSAAMARAMAC